MSPLKPLQLRLHAYSFQPFSRCVFSLNNQPTCRSISFHLHQLQREIAQSKLFVQPTIVLELGICQLKPHNVVCQEGFPLDGVRKDCWHLLVKWKPHSPHVSTPWYIKTAGPGNTIEFGRISHHGLESLPVSAPQLEFYALASRHVERWVERCGSNATEAARVARTDRTAPHARVVVKLARRCASHHHIVQWGPCHLGADGRIIAGRPYYITCIHNLCSPSCTEWIRWSDESRTLANKAEGIPRLTINACVCFGIKFRGRGTGP